MTEIVKALTKKEILHRQATNESIVKSATHKFKEDCIKLINAEIQKYNWGAYSEPLTIKVPYQLFTPYLYCNPTYSISVEVYGELVKLLEEAGYIVKHQLGGNNTEPLMLFILTLPND